MSQNTHKRPCKRWRPFRRSVIVVRLNNCNSLHQLFSNLTQDMNKSAHAYNLPVSLFPYRDRSLPEFLNVLTVSTFVYMAKLVELYRTNSYYYTIYWPVSAVTYSVLHFSHTHLIPKFRNIAMFVPYITLRSSALRYRVMWWFLTDVPEEYKTRDWKFSCGVAKVPVLWHDTQCQGVNMSRRYEWS
jgi:hypothetical protein